MKKPEERPVGPRMADIRAVIACPGYESEFVETLAERIEAMKEELTAKLTPEVTEEKRTTIAIYRELMNLLPTRLANLERGKETKPKQTP